ncbi:hypothetical protein HPK20_15490 [Vibrio fluvialis]|uniref:hypothetical protein n=1 Tax=Vibrio fluvialis TaxID=676 RepID=UPI00140511C7|nr:hypothetical protein [Vibrio fluvialis]MBY8130832.1 hypothetical protein [Vibrio fluvialis]NHN75225.1 hypothetical protein [Vibrio fluvialis]QKE35907.1 hypothetical protein HPK20_15490 [Vibrio fluvialis]
MNNYEKFLRSVSEVKTLSAHLTALGKIKLASEDEKFKAAIDSIIPYLQRKHAKSKAKSTPVSLDKTNIQEINALISACQKVVGTKKPEWQILAERHGWEPKA